MLSLCCVLRYQSRPLALPLRSIELFAIAALAQHHVGLLRALVDQFWAIGGIFYRSGFKRTLSMCKINLLLCRKQESILLVFYGKLYMFVARVKLPKEVETTSASCQYCSLVALQHCDLENTERRSRGVLKRKGCKAAHTADVVAATLRISISL